MADSQLKLALRIEADLKDAIAGIEGAADAVEELGDRAGGASQNMGRLYDNAAEQIQAIGELQERLDAGASSLEELARTETMVDQAMAAGLLTMEEQAQALAELDKQERQLIQSRERQTRAVDGVLRRYDPASAALRRLVRDEQALNQALQQGIITREQYNRSMVGIVAQRAQWTQVSNGVEQTARSMGRLNLNSIQAQQSLVGAARAAASGNWSLASSNLVTLGSRAGALSAIFSPLGLAIAGSAASLAVFGAAAFRGYQETQELYSALVLVGREYEVVTGSVEASSRRIDEATNTYGRSREALTALIATAAVSRESLEDAGRAAVALSELTGRSVRDTVREVSRLSEAPARTVAELNRQYRFVTASVYEQIRALEAQGRTQDAARLATQAFADETVRRLNQVEDNLGSLERGWNNVGRAAGFAWDRMKDLGRSRGPELELQLARQRVDELTTALDEIQRGDRAIGLRQSLDSVVADYRVEIEKAVRRVEEWQEEVDRARGVADRESETQEIEAAGIAAIDWADRRLAQADREIQKRKELNELQARFNDLAAAGIDEVDGMATGDLYAKLREDIEKRYTDRPTRQRDQRDPAADFLASLERQVSLLGQATEASRAYFEITEGAYKNASEAVKQQILDQAMLLDSERERIGTQEEIARMMPELLRQVGRETEAAALDMERQYGDLIRRLRLYGNEEGASLLEEAIGAERARDELRQLEQQVERVFGDIQRREARILAQVQSRLITEAEAQRQLVALYSEQNEIVEELLPRMEALALAIGDEQALERVRQVRFELEQMVQTTDLLRNAVVNTFEGAFRNLLTNLVDGNESLRDTVRGFFADMARGLADFAAAQLAQMAAVALMKALTGDLAQPDPAEAAAAGAAYAAPVAGAAMAMTASGAALGTGAVAVSAAAAQLQMAANTMLLANSMGGFADGGYTGPGGKYQVAGWVHAGEGVLTQEEISALGGPSGFYALRNAIASGALDLPGYANGGLVAPAPSGFSMPSFDFNADAGMAAAQAPQVHLRNINLIDSAELVEGYFDDPRSDGTFVNKFRRNRDAIMQELQA